jgi:23S rRNA pseudouridine955/2504/2580 synthase
MKLTACMDDHERRLDRILRKSCPKVPISAIHKMLRTGKVLVNGRKAVLSARVNCGDVIEIAKFYDSPESTQETIPANNPIEIIFENNDVIVLNKKAGLVCHGTNSLEIDVLYYLTGKLPASLSFKPGPLHRLDRETSGAIIFSKSLAGARYISGGFRDGLFKKTYMAITAGQIKKTELWEDNLERDKILKKTFCSTADNNAQAKKAVTKIIPIASKNNVSLVFAEISTGRTHQIRVQAAAHNVPLLYDEKYGGVKNKDNFFLHSFTIEFPQDNPLNLPQKINAPLPPAFENKIKELFGNI